MAMPHKYSTVRISLVAASLAAIFLALAACSRPAPAQPEFEATDGWWVTTPQTRLNGYSTVQVEVTFRNITAITVDFLGDTGTNQPSDDIQIWTAPNVEVPPATFDDFPVGSYDPEETMHWVFTLDLSGLSDTENQIAIRPRSQNLGTMGPTQVELVDMTLTWVR